MSEVTCQVWVKGICGLMLALGAWLGGTTFAAAQTYLPSMKIGTAPLVSPTDANNFYGSDTGASHHAGYNASPPEIVSLAVALKNDPDLIYHYVRDNIEVVWEYGLQKGALGASIDKAGTPFDQALLMVALLRRAGYTANLEAGTIVLSGSQFAAWTNISDATAACQMLSGGGIPAQINGSTVASCAYGTGTAISSVRMAHIWVKVAIPGSTCGSNCLFDPNYKPYRWLAGIDLAGATGITPGAALSAAAGGMESGSQFSLPYVRNLGAGSLNGLLQGYATSLLTYLKNNNLGGAEMEDIVSGGVIIPEPSASLRQSSLPDADPSPPYAVHDWTDIPDKYRTTLEVSATMNTVALFDVKFFADEIYGRRLTIGTNFNSDDMHFPDDFKTFIASLKLDDQVLATQSISVVPDEHFPAPVTIIANHPYAAQVNGTPGDYMDVTLTKDVTLVTPVSIVAGWGDTGPELLSKWSGERAQDLAAPGRLNQVCPAECPEPIYMSPIGDYTREKAQAGYLGQFTRAAHLHAALAGGLVQIHHVLGVVYADDTVDDDGNSHPPDSPANYFVTDSFTRLDIDTGLSFASKTADPLARRAAVQAIAATSAAIEGAVVAQTSDVPDTASTASRFEWGNAPSCAVNAAPYWNCEDPSAGGPRKFFQLGPNVAVPSGFAVWENGVPPPVDHGNDSLGAPQNWASDQMNALTGFIGAYTAAGFTVTTSQEAFLGPGQRGGYIKVNGAPPTESYDSAWTKQRGGAFVATRYDANGDPLEIAHDVVGLIAPDASGHLVPVKGGGGGTPPSAGATYNPATAADILKSRFVDRSNALGVNLSNGSMSYSSPASIGVGNGGFPYELSASHAFHQGAVPTADFGPIFPGSPAGWTSNWYNALTISGSGMEGMGASDVRAAAGAIAAFMAAQDIYRDPPSAKRDVAAVLTQSWLMHQFSGNSVSVTLSGATRQFVRLADASWIAPGAAYATLTQSGTRAPFTYICPIWNATRGADYALSRGWDASGLSFTVTNAQGDAQHFVYWQQHYQSADSGVGSQCGRASGFRLDSWTFPQHVTVTAHYSGDTSGSDGANHSSSPNAGTSYPSSTTLDYVDNGIGRRLTFVANTPNITDGTRTLQGPQLLGGGAFGVVDPAGDVTDFTLGPAMATSPTQRPVPYQPLTQVHTPFNLALAPDPHTLDLQYDYDALGQVAVVHDAVALQTGARNPYAFYIAGGTRGERDDPLGAAYTVVYDTYKHPSRYIDELGRETDATFDGRGRVTSYTYPELDREFFAYDDHDNTTGYTRQAKPGSPLANLNVSAVYDPTWNKPTSVTNARGVTTTFTYYASGNGASLMATALRPADGFDNGAATYSFSYNAAGQVLTAADPDGVVTASGYDGSGNLTSTSLDPANISIVTQFGYDTFGNITSTTDPRGFVTTSSYDADRRKTEDDHHDGSSSAVLLSAAQILYEAHGWVTDAKVLKTLSPTTIWVTAAHDSYTPSGKVASVTDADNRTVVTTYDALDRVDTVTDPVGKAVHSTYDAAGELLVESRGWGTPLSEAYATHTYTPNGKEHTVYDALGGSHLTTYSYDGFDRLSSAIYADASHEDLSYDEDGNVTSRTTRAGPVLTYVYDLLDRLRSKQIPNWNDAPAHQVAWSYTLAGRTTLADDAAGQTSVFLIDTAGRTTDELASAVNQGGTLHVAWTFDKAGNRTRLTWPDGYAVDYVFDGLNRMASATETGGSQLALYVYDPLSRRIDVTFNGGTSAMAYSYSDAGDLLTLSDDLASSVNDVTFTSNYTPAHRLQSVATSNTAYIWSPSAAASSAYAAVNNLNQYPSVDSAAMTWDGNGNLLANGSAAFSHDAENRMLTASGSGITSAYL